MSHNKNVLSQWINGAWHASQSTFKIFDPGQKFQQIGEIYEATEAQVNTCVEAANRAQKDWCRTLPNERAERLQKAADIIAQNQPELTRLLCLEQGMLQKDTARDVRNAITALREAADIGLDYLAEQHHEDAQSRLLIMQRPRGVVAAMIPWNAPMSLCFGKLGPALMTGNSIIVKPSPGAPLGLTRALTEISTLFPEGTINVVQGTLAGSWLARHSGVHKLSFTGSIENGVAVLQAAAATLKHVTLELGGNDPALILPDAPAEATVANIFRQAMTRTGQYCYAIKRVYVPEHQYLEYCERFHMVGQHSRVGYATDESANMAPLHHQYLFDRINQLASAAMAAGAHVKTVGQFCAQTDPHTGFYMLPRIVSGIDADHPLVQTEQFGPILPIVPYRDIEQGIAFCNQSRYGLGASIWSADTAVAEQLLERIKTGVGFVNSHKRTPLGDRKMPFGGSKMSGLGRTRTHIGFAEYTETYARSTLL